MFAIPSLVFFLLYSLYISHGTNYPLPYNERYHIPPSCFRHLGNGSNRKLQYLQFCSLWTIWCFLMLEEWGMVPSFLFRCIAENAVSWLTYIQGLRPNAICVILAIANNPQSDVPLCLCTFTTLTYKTDLLVRTNLASITCVSILNSEYRES